MSEEITVHVVDYGRSNLYLRYLDPITGKHVAKSSRTGDEDAARKAAGKWEAELREGRYKSPSKVTWADFRERYETEVLPGLSEGSWGKVFATFNDIETHTPIERIMSLTPERISQWQQKLRSTGQAETTIKSKSAHLKAALNWAKDIGMIHSVPKIRMPKRAKNSKVMKGRPITAEEFDRMLEKVPQVVGRDRADSWSHLLRGLWWSGLRITEAMTLTWDDHGMRVDLSGKYPMLSIPADYQKSNKDEMLPIAPEFAEMLLSTPEDQRKGFVFNPARKHSTERFKCPREAGRTIRLIGQRANIKVDEFTRKGKTVIKYATAHDLRRAFGTRWAPRVMPVDLQKLMRHETIETTMKFYVNQNADDIAGRLYAALNPSGNTLGNTQPESSNSETVDNVEAA